MQENIPSLIGKEQLNLRVKELGAAITTDLANESVVVISVLKGSFIFTADLVRSINLPIKIEFLVAASYVGTKSSGDVTISHQLNDLDPNATYLIIEDIIDTGATIEKLLEELNSRGFKKIKVCSLLSKPECHQMPIDYVGFEIGNEFVVGYGLDYDQKFRNLPYIGLLKS